MKQFEGLPLCFWIRRAGVDGFAVKLYYLLNGRAMTQSVLLDMHRLLEYAQTPQLLPQLGFQALSYCM